MIYTLSKQEKDYYCIPAVIQGILYHHGVYNTQDEIAREIGCIDERGVIFGEKLDAFFQKRDLNFSYVNYNEVYFRSPSCLLEGAVKMQRDVMVGAIGPGERGLHIKLMTDFKDPLIKLLDPDTLLEHIGDIEEIYRKMCNNRLGGFGIVSTI